MNAFVRLIATAALATSVSAGAANFGGEMPAGPAQSIADAVKGYAGAISEPAKFSGRVAKVCRKKGCWMELEADGLSARVTMLDYGFFLPTDAHGDAEVFGTLSKVDLDEATAAHYAKDAGVDVSEIPRNEYRLVAHAVTLSAP